MYGLNERLVSIELNYIYLCGGKAKKRFCFLLLLLEQNRILFIEHFANFTSKEEAQSGTAV